MKSLATITRTVKLALWERKYFCKTKGLKLYTKFIKTKYNKARRRAALCEIEDALYDVEPQESLPYGCMTDEEAELYENPDFMNEGYITIDFNEAA